MKTQPLQLKILVFLFALSPAPLQSGFFNKLFIWNVGQGSWATYQSAKHCYHLDMGGERAPLKLIKARCLNRLNSVAISHTDNDHIKFLGWGETTLPRLCLTQIPREEMKPHLSGRLRRLKKCANLDALTEVDFSLTSAKKNDLSRVYVLQSKILSSTLFPGDSTAFAEGIWAPQLKTVPPIRVIVLGHHGSRTSSSPLLLKNLPHLKIAACSARKKRYGHPHPLVIERMRSKGVPVICTEIWGNIAFDI